MRWERVGMEYVVIKNRWLWLRLAFWPFDWGWLWERCMVNCGPFCAWWLTGKGAKDLMHMPRNWNKPYEDN